MINVCKTLSRASKEEMYTIIFVNLNFYRPLSDRIKRVYELETFNP